jgi:hypothetical protein
MINWDTAGISVTAPAADGAIEQEQMQPLPWRASPENFHAWVASAPIKALRLFSTTVVKRELDFRLQGRRPYWEVVEKNGLTEFRLQIEAGSLWSLLWEFVGLDSSEGTTWRVCPHCGKIFYPKRKDQTYCTKEQQALASKRDWARRYRLEERARKVGGR